MVSDLVARLYVKAFVIESIAAFCSTVFFCKLGALTVVFYRWVGLRSATFVRQLLHASMLVLTLVLAGCAIPTPPQQVILDNTSTVVVEAHQQRLNEIYRWQLSARLAIVQKLSDERDGLYLDWRWQRQPAARQQLRFSHPLKGQLANLTLLPTGATLTIHDARYSGANGAQLLKRVLGVQLPVVELSNWVIGKTTAALTHKRYISGGRIAAATVTQSSGERWRIHWFYASDDATLPEQIHLESNQLRIKMQLNQWQLTPALSSLDTAQEKQTNGCSAAACSR